MSHFSYTRQVQFYETDLMGIVHHANYLRWAEEARVAWGFAKGLLTAEDPGKAAELAVLQTEVRHLKPAQFGDPIRVELQVHVTGIQIVFEYKVWKHDTTLASEIRTTHVALEKLPNGKMKSRRPSDTIMAILEKEQWIETWLSSL